MKKVRSFTCIVCAVCIACFVINVSPSAHASETDSTSSSLILLQEDGSSSLVSEGGVSSESPNSPDLTLPSEDSQTENSSQAQEPQAPSAPGRLQGINPQAVIEVDLGSGTGPYSTFASNGEYEFYGTTATRTISVPPNLTNVKITFRSGTSVTSSNATVPLSIGNNSSVSLVLNDTSITTNSTTNPGTVPINIGTGATVNITLNNATITSYTSNTNAAAGAAAINIGAGSKVKMILDDDSTNTISRTSSYGSQATIQLVSTSELTIGEYGTSSTGTLTVTNPFRGAAIGSASGVTNGKIVINSGTIYASNSGGAGAGIGGGAATAGLAEDQGGTIIINGGTVIATSMYAAGIGGGYVGSNVAKAAYITINEPARVFAYTIKETDAAPAINAVNTDNTGNSYIINARIVSGQIEATERLYAYPDADYNATPVELEYQPNTFRGFAFNVPDPKNYIFVSRTGSSSVIVKIEGSNSMLIPSRTSLVNHIVVRSSPITEYNVNYFKNYADDDTSKFSFSGKHPGNFELIPPIPTARTGYTFVGWTTDRGGINSWPSSGGLMPNYDLDLYAQWAVNSHTLTFYRNYDGSDDVTLSGGGPVNFGTVVTLPAAPTRTGYTFAGWATDRAGTTPWPENGTMPDNTLNLYAIWTEKKYTVSFMNNYLPLTEYSSLRITDITGGATIPAPSQEPTRTGYLFAGWYKTEVGLNPGATDKWDFDADTVTDDMNLYAGWNSYNFSVTFNLNYGTNAIHATLNVVSPDVNVGTLPADPSRVGYTFVGWFDTQAANGGTQFLATTAVTQNVTVYARWEVNSHTFTLYRNYDGSDSTTLSGGGLVNFGTVVTLPAAPIRTGYTFAGWATDRAGNTLWPTNGTMPDSDLNLYAQWEEDAAVTSTVTFYRNYNSSDNTTVNGGGTFAVGTVIVLPSPAPTRTNYTFLGWAQGRDGSNPWPSGGTLPATLLKLYAQWKASSSSSDPSSSSNLPPSSSSSSSSNASSSSNSASRGTSSNSSSNTSSTSPYGQTSSRNSSSSNFSNSQNSSQNTNSISNSPDNTKPSNNSRSANAEKREEIRNQMIQSGIPVIQLGNLVLPLYSGGESFVWSLLSLLFVIIGFFIAIFTALLILQNRGFEKKSGQKILRTISLGLGISSVLLFFVLYNFNGVAILFDTKTIVFGLLLVTEIITLKFAGRADTGLDEKI